MGRLDGKATIISGGEGSIRLTTARTLVAEGANVFLAGLSEPDLKAAAAALNDIGRDGAVAWSVTDVTDSAGHDPPWPSRQRGHVIVTQPWRGRAPRALR